MGHSYVLGEPLLDPHVDEVVLVLPADAPVGASEVPVTYKSHVCFRKY
jgi:hypothetical protein